MLSSPVSHPLENVWERKSDGPGEANQSPLPRVPGFVSRAKETLDAHSGKTHSNIYLVPTVCTGQEGTEESAVLGRDGSVDKGFLCSRESLIPQKPCKARCGHVDL